MGESVHIPDFFTGFSVEQLNISMKNGRIRLRLEDFDLTQGWDGTEIYRVTGRLDGLRLEWLFYREEHGGSFEISLSSERALDCDSIAASLRYREPGEDLSRRRVLCGGKRVQDAGLHPLGGRREPPEDSLLCGLFDSSRRPCLLLGTRLPQSNLHLYKASLIGRDQVTFTVTTRFTRGQGKLTELKTERTLVIFGKTPLEAMGRFGERLPPLTGKAYPPPLVGWNSWDYYFAALSHEDIMENLREISGDPVLRQRLTSLIVDDGWQHREGDWHPNHHFPQGMEHTAAEISRRGLIPGIWTNGCQIGPLTHNALRKGQMLLRDEYGNALVEDGMYVVDPTHPDGEAYLRETYTRLYGWGYRIFKVDFISVLTRAGGFYREECGPYEAIRLLLRIVRESVGEDSHILGCSYPVECGPGLCDSLRISVDIHNQWTHVLWVLEYLQALFWTDGRIGRIDPDFLVVRGRGTSLEEETNVFNPVAGGPAPEGDIAARWRRGPVFDELEAETWANVAVFAGGNLILGDRLSMLNEKGKRLLYGHLEPEERTASPLDLGDGPVASYWHSARRQGGRLLIINHEEETRRMRFSFADFGLVAPEEVRCDKKSEYNGGVLQVTLRRHESAVLDWENA